MLSYWDVNLYQGLDWMKTRMNFLWPRTCARAKGPSAAAKTNCIEWKKMAYWVDGQCLKVMFLKEIWDFQRLDVLVLLFPPGNSWETIIFLCYSFPLGMVEKPLSSKKYGVKSSYRYCHLYFAEISGKFPVNQSKFFASFYTNLYQIFDLHIW